VPAALIRLVVTTVLLLVAATLSPLATASAAPTVEDPSAGPSSSVTASDAASPSASATPSAPATSSAPAGTSAAPSASSGPSSSPSAATKGRARAAETLTTTITARPTVITTTGQATFSYRANLPGARFRCRLKGPGMTADTFVTCPGGTSADPDNPSKGSTTYTGLTPSRTAYVFTVRAYLPVGAGQPSEVTGSPDTFSWNYFTVYSPAHHSPAAGASFNRPLAGKRYQRTNLTKIVRAINSMPGYKEAAPTQCRNSGDLVPSTIRISAYSITDAWVARALVAADRRCVSVQVLMNNHLSRSTDPAWRLLEDALGKRVYYTTGTAQRSFAHRCSYGCRGAGVLHTKMYLFDSTLLDRTKNKIQKMVATGSSNMTGNASKVQWNDLYTVRGQAGFYDTFLRVFDLMKKDDGVHKQLIRVTNGIYQSTFWPQADGTADPYMHMLRSVSCRGANGGAGIHGRSVVYINMHAWFGTRGTALAKKVRSMYNAGCYVRVLYSFMSYKVYKTLVKGAGSRMSVRRTIYSRNGRSAYLYSHFKNVSVSGNVGGDRSAKVVWTGSNNFTNDGTHFDEVAIRIASASAYRSYVGQFKYITRTKSSTGYVHFTEPSGGGRAPKRMMTAAGTVDAPAGTPTISSGAITFDESGEPHAVD
jgi:hypothetical protein